MIGRKAETYELHESSPLAISEMPKESYNSCCRSPSSIVALDDNHYTLMAK